MVLYKIHLDGKNEDDAEILSECLYRFYDGIDYDEEPSTDFEGEAYDQIGTVDEVADFAIDIAMNLPDCDFVLIGRAYDEYNDTASDFIIEYKSKKLTVKHTEDYEWEGDPYDYHYEQSSLEYMEREIQFSQVFCTKCGDRIYQEEPVYKDKNGLCYHIWCAEELDDYNEDAHEMFFAGEEAANEKEDE